MFVFLGLAALFVPVLFGYTAVYVARCYAVVLTQSSGGADRIRWPKDKFPDWVVDACIVLVVFVALVSLTTILTAPLALAVPQGWQAFALLGLAILFFWLAFPIALCSAHHPALIAALPQRFGPMIRVWGMTTPLAAAVAFGVGLMFIGNMAGPFVVALVGPATILVHARAWGRFVWLALNERPRRRRVPKSDFPPEPETAVRSKEPTAAAKAAVDEGAIELAPSDWTPDSGNLAEYYEIQRERERWNRMRAGEETVDPLGRPKPPKPWTALAPSKIFGILLESDTAAAGIGMSVGLGILAAVAFAIRLSI